MGCRPFKYTNLRGCARRRSGPGSNAGRGNTGAQDEERGVEGRRYGRHPIPPHTSVEQARRKRRPTSVEREVGISCRHLECTGRSGVCVQPCVRYPVPPNHLNTLPLHYFPDELTPARPSKFHGVVDSARFVVRRDKYQAPPPRTRSVPSSRQWTRRGRGVKIMATTIVINQENVLVCDAHGDKCRGRANSV